MEKFYTCDMCGKDFNAMEFKPHDIDVVQHYDDSPLRMILSMGVMPVYVRQIIKRKVLCADCYSNISAVKFPEGIWGDFLRFCYIMKNGTHSIHKIAICVNNKGNAKFKVDRYRQTEDEKLSCEKWEIDFMAVDVPDKLRSMLQFKGKDIDITDFIDSEFNLLERIN